MTSSATANDILRRALLKVDAARVLGLVDELDLSPRSRISAVVGVPLRSLQQRRDVVGFATSAPMPAVRALVELLSVEALERIVETLGESAESPSYEQLAAALDAVADAGTSVDELIAVLAFAIGEEFPAAAHCRRLLDERPAFALPELGESSPPSLIGAPREVDPAVREARRARREAQRRRKVAPPSGPRRVKIPRPDPPRREPEKDRTVPVTRDAGRRRARLSPREAASFDTDHPSAGSVMLLDVPFVAVDPEAEEATLKRRPALVVAASEEGALVRPIYSQPFAGRSLFGPWRRLLEHASYISDERVGVPWPEDRVSLGVLSDEEWNALQ